MNPRTSKTIRFVLTVLTAGALSCGQQQGGAPAPSLGDEAINKTEISLMTMALSGWGVGNHCNPNGTLDSNKSIDPNIHPRCVSGPIKQLTNTGKIIQDVGCFIRTSNSPAETLANQCTFFGHSEEQLGTDQWYIIKKRLLATAPLRIESFGCSDQGIVCPGDSITNTLDITIDGQTNTIEWPGGAIGLPSSLQDFLVILQELKFTY